MTAKKYVKETEREREREREGGGGGGSTKHLDVYC